jgi:hypothetical protein
MIRDLSSGVCPTGCIDREADERAGPRIAREQPIRSFDRPYGQLSKRRGGCLHGFRPVCNQLPLPRNPGVCLRQDS